MTVSQGVAIHLPDTFLFAHSRDAVGDLLPVPILWSYAFLFAHSRDAVDDKKSKKARDDQCFYSLIREMRSMTPAVETGR